MRRSTQDANYLSICFLKKLGIEKPTKQQIELVDSILLRTNLNVQMIFHPKLTIREAACLLWTANGKSVEETADLLKVKPTTVLTWRERIREKLESKTMEHAVKIGISYCYVPPHVISTKDISS